MPCCTVRVVLLLSVRRVRYCVLQVDTSPCRALLPTAQWVGAHMEERHHATDCAPKHEKSPCFCSVSPRNHRRLD